MATLVPQVKENESAFSRRRGTPKKGGGATAVEVTHEITTEPAEEARMRA